MFDDTNYASENYPRSAKWFSRPFSHDLWSEVREPTRNKMIFLNALHNAGLAFLDYALEPNLDVEAAIARPSFMAQIVSRFDIEKTQGTGGVHAYLHDLPLEARSAVSFLTKEILAQKERNRTQDMPAIGNAFQVFWAAEPFADPRLSMAEELFITHGGEREILPTSRYFKQADSSLAWMLNPVNAKEIGFMFLYSRLAQHCGETRPEEVSLMVADLETAIQTGCGEKAIQQIGANIYAEAFKSAGNLFARWGKKEDGPFEPPFMIVKDAKELHDCASQLVEDYKRLTTGAWAGAIQTIARIKRSELTDQGMRLYPGGLGRADIAGGNGA